MKADVHQTRSENRTETTSKLTKRRILSQIARIFDPIGFVSAFLVRAKIGRQRLWQLGVEWDEELPPTEQARWLSLFREMEQLNDVEFQRCITPMDTVGKPMLCTGCPRPGKIRENREFCEKNSLQGKIREFGKMGKIREKSGNFTKTCQANIREFSACFIIFKKSQK